MQTIHVETIRHDEQRYPTCGDYWTDEAGVRQFRISNLSNGDYEFLITIHEMIESYLCQRKGTADADIDAFDLEYEQRRQPGDNSEPGDDPEAPYYWEHGFATLIERILARHMGIAWSTYDEAVNSL
jgi:hypothetical protein